MRSLRKIGFSKLTFLEDAIKKLDPYIKPIQSEELETSKALNRILTNNIISEFDIPPFDRSAMDGYAVRAEDTFGASQANSKIFKKIGTSEIGEVSENVVKKGEAVRISTGAAIPIGADSVVKIEDTEIKDNELLIYAPIVPGKNISKAGEDISRGTEVLNTGVTIKASHIALLSSLGYKKISVKKKTEVSVFAVGDELIEVGNILPKNKIYNSNSPMVSNLVEMYGGKVIRELSLADNKDEIKRNLFTASEDSNVIIFTGGTSVGTKDFLPDVMQENGVVLVHGIAIRPGSPILIGLIDHTLVFCLPGTPVAAYVCFLMIVGPTIRKIMGSIIEDPRSELIAIINNDVPVSRLGYKHFLRVKLEKQENIFLANPVKLKGSGIISSLTQSDGIVEIPEDKEGLKKGEKVLVYLNP